MPRIALAGCFGGEYCTSLGDVPELWIAEDTRLILRPTYSMTRKSLLRLRHEILNFGRQIWATGEASFYLAFDRFSL